MRLSPVLKTGVWITALCLCAQGQTAPGNPAAVNESKGMPPRISPAEYQAHAQHPVRTPRQVCVWCYLIAQWHGGHEVTVVLKPLTCIGVARGFRTYAARMVLSLNASIIIGR